MWIYGLPASGSLERPDHRMDITIVPRYKFACMPGYPGPRLDRAVLLRHAQRTSVIRLAGFQFECAGWAAAARRGGDRSSARTWAGKAAPDRIDRYTIYSDRHHLAATAGEGHLAGPGSFCAGARPGAVMTSSRADPGTAPAPAQLQRPCCGTGHDAKAAFQGDALARQARR